MFLCYINTCINTTVSCPQEVSSQLWATLYDYPCLKTCAGLHQYICDAVRLAWALVNQVIISPGTALCMFFKCIYIYVLCSHRRHVLVVEDVDLERQHALGEDFGFIRKRKYIITVVIPRFTT